MKIAYVRKSFSFRRARIVPLLTVSGLLLVFVNSAGAYYHDLEMNRQPCSDCHTMHYSEDRAQPANAQAGGPFPRLLNRSTTNVLCLFCHDGSDPKAPDVMAPVTMYDGSGDEHSGAGFFAAPGAVNPNGHDLDVNAPTVPFSSRTNATLTCASCHDPHGTPNYRNTLTMDKVPSTAEPGYTGTNVVMGVDVFRNIAPGNPPSTQGSINAYKRSNEGYKAKTSLWCTGCHDQLKTSIPGPGGTRIHHFWDFPINGLIDGVLKTDPDHWVGGTGSGFGAVTGDGVEGIPRLRFQAPGATDFASSQIAAAGNNVICASCHLAHGGKYQKGLVWPYLGVPASSDSNSGCQQCHNY